MVGPMVHVCGACKSCHYQHGDGLRPLTPAELFSLHMSFPKGLDAATKVHAPSSTTPAGTLILAKG